MFSHAYFGEELTTIWLLLELLLAAVIVVISGTRLSGLADRLADELNLSSGWVGLILLATATSLPEVVTGSTATWIGNADLAFAAILGSCAFNMLLLVPVNLAAGGGSVFRKAGTGHALTGAFSILLVCLPLAGMIFGTRFADHSWIPQVCELGMTVAILLAYFVCMRVAYQYEKTQQLEQQIGIEPSPPGKAPYLQVGAIVTILVATTWWLTQTADVLSTHEIQMIGRPLGATFVGALFLAGATSLPEIATCLAAIRLGNMDLALGNLFGSNMFNITIIPVLKGVSFVRGDALLMAGESFNLTSNLTMGLLAVILTAIALGGLVCRSPRRVLGRLSPDSVLIAVVYTFGMILLMV